MVSVEVCQTLKTKKRMSICCFEAHLLATKTALSRASFLRESLYFNHVIFQLELFSLNIYTYGWLPEIPIYFVFISSSLFSKALHSCYEPSPNYRLI